MTPEQKTAYVIAQSSCMLAELEGMKAATNQELQRQVAEATGWKKLHWELMDKVVRYGANDYELEAETVLLGVPPGISPIEVRVPNWPEDLPACMVPSGPWEWLIKNGLHPTLWSPGRNYRAKCEVSDAGVHIMPFTGIGPDPMADCALAICHAVLAVAEKMREQADDSKG